jgi:hypothetical protein
MTKGADGAALLNVLAVVASAGSTLDPVWDSHERCGYAYPTGDTGLTGSQMREALEQLAETDYLERVFVERVSLCPTCDSHAVNVHESCVSCGSSNLMQFKALFHFRCGFVGPTTAFKAERKGLRCPKCNRILADLGTDHDSPGEYFRCLACTAMFQTAEPGIRCMSCGARLRGTAIQTLHQHNVYAYRLSAVGRGALDQKKLMDSQYDVSRVDHNLTRRSDVVGQAKNVYADGEHNVVIVVHIGEGSPEEAAQKISAVTNNGKNLVTLGRLDSENLLAIVAADSSKQAQNVRESLTKSGYAAAVVNVAEGETVEGAIELAARSLQQQHA